MSRDDASSPQKSEDISDVDCTIFAVGRSPKTKHLGLEKLVQYVYNYYCQFLVNYVPFNL